VVTQRPWDWDPSHPAPEPLERVRLFANTLDLYRHRDALADEEHAAVALRAIGLLRADERLSARDIERVRRLRSAVRSRFIAEESAPEGVSDLDLRVVLGGDGTVAIEAARPGLWGELTYLCLELYVAQRTGRLSRLKACANPQCRWLFWDTSRPGTGRWCSMQVCGGQHKARMYRRRRKRTS
jgi:hypothetical protein